MADRRMFSKSIIDSDLFLDMPQSAQCLYFHLAMRADDDGFVNSPRKIQRMIGASEDDCRLLVAKQFLIPFETGVVVIRHWRIHNYIQKDRYKETMYQSEKSALEQDSSGAYQLMDTPCIHPVSEMDNQVRLGKGSLGQGSLGEDSEGEKKGRKRPTRAFVPPTVEEVQAYCYEISASIDPFAFVDYYAAQGWVYGKAGKQMKDWRAAVRNWDRREKQNGGNNGNRTGIDQRSNGNDCAQNQRTKRLKNAFDYLNEIRAGANDSRPVEQTTGDVDWDELFGVP